MFESLVCLFPQVAFAVLWHMLYVLLVTHLHCITHAHASCFMLCAISQARIDPRLISKAKKAEKKATAGRLLEPLQKRKPPTNAPGERAGC